MEPLSRAMLALRRHIYLEVNVRVPADPGCRHETGEWPNSFGPAAHRTDGRPGRGRLTPKGQAALRRWTNTAPTGALTIMSTSRHRYTQPTSPPIGAGGRPAM